MKILVTHSNGFDFKKELYLPLRNSVLNSEHQIILPHETDSFLYTKPLLEKKEVELVLAEVSYISTGQGIELGWADSFNIPIVCVYKKEIKYSASLSVILEMFIEYKDPNELLKKFSRSLLDLKTS